MFHRCTALTSSKMRHSKQSVIQQSRSKQAPGTCSIRIRSFTHWHRYVRVSICVVSSCSIGSRPVFTMNVYQDYAHPDRRPKIHAYPEFTKGAVSEVWQAAKWLVDAPDRVLTPMIRKDGKDYYVNEILRCVDSSLFMPTRFFMFEGKMWSKGYHATETAVCTPLLYLIEISTPCTFLTVHRAGWHEYP